MVTQQMEMPESGTQEAVPESVSTLPVFESGEISELCQFEVEDNQKGRYVAFVIPRGLTPVKVLEIFANTYCNGQITEMFGYAKGALDYFKFETSEIVNTVDFTINFPLANLRECDQEDILAQVQVQETAKRTVKAFKGNDWQSMVAEIRKSAGRMTKEFFWTPDWQVILACWLHRDKNGWNKHDGEGLTAGIYVRCHGSQIDDSGEKISLHHREGRITHDPNGSTGVAPVFSRRGGGC